MPLPTPNRSPQYKLVGTRDISIAVVLIALAHPGLPP